VEIVLEATGWEHINRITAALQGEGFRTTFNR